MTAARVRQARGAAAELERFFRLADPAAETAEWQPVSLLYATGHGPLDEILDAVRAAKGNRSPQVAASIFFLGYAARLLSPPLACIATANCLPDMPADRLLWRVPQAGEMIRLAMTSAEGWAGSRERLMAHLVRGSFEEHLQPLTRAVRSRVRIAPSILRDNAASALINGLRLVNGADWKVLAEHALGQPCLRGSGSLPDTGPPFVRQSCCLFYLEGRCGDCPLDFRPDGTRRI